MYLEFARLKEECPCVFWLLGYSVFAVSVIRVHTESCILEKVSKLFSPKIFSDLEKVWKIEIVLKKW